MGRCEEEPACCRCNRTGRCRRCACVKAGQQCVNCLPIKLGNCQNGVSHIAVPVPAVASTPSSAMPPNSMPPNSIQPNSILPQSSISASPPLPASHSRPRVSLRDRPTTDFFSPPAGQVSFIWGEVDGATFHSQITVAYEVVIHWKPYLFIPLRGTTGNMFVHELAKMFQSFTDGSSLGSIAMKAATVQQQLLLQKPSRSRKSKDYIHHLQRCLDLWQKGDLDTLLHERRSVQSQNLGLEVKGLLPALLAGS